MNKTKILIVEDEIITADYLSNILKAKGYEVLDPVINYTEAIESAKKYQPDLAILDINLSGYKSGIDVAEYLNEHVSIPFIFLTSYGDIKTVQSTKHTQPSGYLTKPFKKEDIQPAIEIALSNFNKVNNINETIVDPEINKKWQQLTESEKKVISKISENKTSRIIADELFISMSTVKNHRHSICRKLELPSSNNSLMNWALINKSSLI